MTHFLTGLQYRTQNLWISPSYGEWKDITTEYSFTRNTQFRIAPEFSYDVHSTSANSDSIKIINYDGKSNAMAYVAKLIDTGDFVKVRRVEKTSIGVAAF